MNDEHNKETAISSLMVTLQRGQNLALRLKFAGKNEEYSSLKTKNVKLSQNIDQLIELAMNNWMSNVQQLNKDIKADNKKLQTAITNIKNEKKKTENIVKAIGLIDDVLSLTAALIP